MRLAQVIPLRPEFAGPSLRRTTPRKGSSAAQARGSTCKDSSFSWWTLSLAVVIVLGVFGSAYYPVVRVQYREYRDRARLQSELEAIQARNTRLEAGVARLRTPEGVEDYARVQLGLAKRGEHMVVVRDPAAPPKKVAQTEFMPDIDSAHLAGEPVGPWTAFLDLVFGMQ